MKKKIFILSFVITLIDQLIKLLVINSLMGHQPVTIINDFFYLTYVQNEGAAWGILTGNRWFLVIVSVLAIYAIIKYFILDTTITKIEFFSYIILLGGIVGNLIDRIFRGYVIDYLNFTIGTYQFPIFNLADMLIVIGTVLIILHLISNVVKQRRK